MPRLRGTRYLTCFYCGKRSNTKFDGSVRDFLCLFCDATNYLDENGDITDPPVATEREAPATLFAAPRESSPAVSQAQDSIFCSTCLKNQHLYTSSLAQYFPDDTLHPDDAELNHSYFRFRKGLEERYPQVCDDCAERVEARIVQAGYTAKTDHLRRMMDKSRGRRDDHGRTTMLDWANTLGRGLWWGGLVVQLLWHLSAVSNVLKHRDEGMYDPDDTSWSKLAASSLAWAVAFLPPAEALINGAFTASVLSAWWNPQFVKVSRGFTRHLLGFTQWYSFQGLIVFFRFFFGRVLEMDGGKAQSRGAQLSAHLVMAATMILIYTLAKGSIRIDTTPLFGTHSTTVSPRQMKPKSTRDESKTFSELFNEALDSPTATPQGNTFNRPPTNSLPSPYPPINPVQTRESPHIQMKSLGISPQTPLQTRQVEYSEEMDWTPTQSQSQHRAFSEMPSASGSARAFGRAPVNPEGSPFWYKVPAAPTTPAQRLRNPNAPILRSKPAPQENVFFPSIDRTKTQAKEENAGDVAFKPPSFFAPATENDETNSLADLLNQSFSLGQEKDGPGPSPSESSKRTSTNRRPTSQTQKPLGVEFIILASLLALWLLTITVPIPFGRELQLAVLSAAGTVALRVTGETNQETKDEAVPSTATYVGSVLSVVELAAVCWLGWEVWKSEADVGKSGGAVLVTMLGHQAWNAAT
ncbi:hypothetical protein QQZ08_009892 [Neonectria magnoliae]|uniref:Ima1 N-terminal domain-containing protein n=1 Tax=Neonectria magnoliae TaxID=2732573 RepID=A0ABR1HL63_9HYPO